MRSRLSLVVLAAMSALACTEPRAPAPTATAEVASGDTPPALTDVPLPRVHEESTSLLYYFLDERGAGKAVARPSEVPVSVRSRVLVTDVSLTAEQRQAHRYNFFADLTAPAADGTYPVIAVSRYDAAKGEGPSALLPSVPAGTVIVYSAEWCGFCKKAKAWLASEQVPFVERDVEKQAGVADELEGKLKQANIRGGGVPVIDWDGTVILGFDKPRLARLLDERRAKGPAPAPSGD